MNINLKGIFAIILAFQGFACFAQDWILAKEKNGIKVYTRESKDSPVKEFKAVTTFETNFLTIEKTLLNIKSYPMWYDMVLSRVSEAFSTHFRIANL
jgi:hypothetical protein